MQPIANNNTMFYLLTAATGTRTLLTSHNYSQLILQLMPAKNDWNPIALALEFQPHGIENIQRDPVRLLDGNHIFDVIAFWLRWAPKDGRGSKDFATLEVLQAALNTTIHGTIKLKI